MRAQIAIISSLERLHNQKCKSLCFAKAGSLLVSFPCFI